MNINYIDMKQEQKDLLIKDLCARLPYGVKFKHINKSKVCKILSITPVYDDVVYFDEYINEPKKCYIDDVKPYLFSLSSMTEEQKYDFYCRFIVNDCDFDDFKEFYLDNGMWHKLLAMLDDIESIIDWFHKNHFDWRGLIPKRLANDATGKNIY